MSAAAVSFRKKGRGTAVCERIFVSMTWPQLAPIVFLCLSNVFMTFAWYGQLKFPNAPIWLVVPVSWGIAFFEYCLERFTEKWNPVFGYEARQNKRLERFSVSVKR
jgi:uncharacterized protein (DUF486 family)